jgi:hypothetical protein
MCAKNRKKIPLEQLSALVAQVEVSQPPLAPECSLGCVFQYYDWLAWQEIGMFHYGGSTFSDRHSSFFVKTVVSAGEPNRLRCSGGN